MLKTQKPEIEFAIAVTQPIIDDSQKKRIKELTEQTLDWDYLIEFTLEHKLTSLFYHQIKAHFAEIIPLERIEQLRQIVMNVTARNMLMTVELIRLLQIFKEAQIPVIFFKGPILAQLAYGDISFRIFDDLDLLIKESDLVKVHNLLTKKCGYTSYDFPDYQINQIAKVCNEYSYFNKNKDILIDVHWHILRVFNQSFSFYPYLEMLWEKLEKIELNNQEIETFSLENFMIYLCLNSAKDAWHKVYLICDLAYLLTNNPQINWQKIESFFGKFGIKRMILISLNLTKIFYNVPLPETIEKEIEANPVINTISNKVQKQIISPTNKILYKFYLYLLYSQSMESGKDKLIFWYYILTSPTLYDLKLISLPRILFPLYYPIRIFRLTTKYIKMALSIN